MPSRLVHIVGNTVIPGTGLAENLRVESGTAEVGIGLNNTSLGGHLWFIESTGNSALEGAGELGFFDDTAGAWRMTLGPTGNVGIGTTTPKTTLQVNGGVSVAVKTITSAYTMTTSDYAILANASTGALTVTLPAASNTGMLVFIKKIDASTNVVTISRAGTDTIEGSATKPLSAKNKSFALIAGGSGVWYVQSNAT